MTRWSTFGNVPRSHVRRCPEIALITKSVKNLGSPRSSPWPIKEADAQDPKPSGSASFPNQSKWKASRQTTKPENHPNFNSAEKHGSGCGVETEIAVRNATSNFSLSTAAPTSSIEISNCVHTTQYCGNQRKVAGDQEGSVCGLLVNSQVY
jgi:hypothetical protein